MYENVIASNICVPKVMLNKSNMLQIPSYSLYMQE